MARRLQRLSLSVAAIAVFLLIHFEVSVGQAPQNEIAPGTMVEKVGVQGEPDQSYAIYLPASYSSAQKWPTVICFDPAARGKFALERFRPAAEKLGYIVACSNNSRNGLDAEVVTRIVTGFWRDVHNRFAIDEQRTYFAGFSGGARLSVGLANRCSGCVAGVLAAGAGFPGDQQPDSKTAYQFVGAVGVDDFNYGELRELENKFEGLQTPRRFYQFQGGHEWPPESLFERALVWFTLQAIKRGTASRNDQFVNEYVATETSEADRFMASQQLVEARSVYASLARDFEHADMQKKLADLKASPELKRQLAQETELYRRQGKEVYEIRGLWMRPKTPDEDRTSRSEARSRVRDWNKQKDGADDSKDRRLARRIISSLRVGSYESARDALRGKNYSVAVANMELVRAIDPTSANAAYELARAQALSSEKKTALSTLEEAIELGFKDIERLKSDSAFTSLTNDPRFQKLISVR